MANRLPQSKAEVSGATSKNPQRYRDRSVPKDTRPVGEPYASMTAEQMAVWKESAANMPWLHSAHRLLLRQVCILAARMDTDPDMGVSALQALGAALSKLGATPADESRLWFADPEEDDDERFFSRPH